jgi:hypothetical protein
LQAQQKPLLVAPAMEGDAIGPGQGLGATTAGPEAQGPGFTAAGQ